MVTVARPAESPQSAVSRTCIFCGAEGPLTNEHVWPRWAQPLLLSDDTLIPVYHVINVDGEAPAQRSFKTRRFTETIHKVCADCNNGWMASLEERAKPLIEAMIADESLTLGQEAQGVLAAWALKTAIVLNAAQSAPWRPSVLTEEARHLAATGTATGNVLVLLSGFIDAPPARSRLWGTTAQVLTQSGERITADIYGATIALSTVCLQVMYTAVPDMADAFALEARPAIHLIWPYRAPLDWSQRNSFADDGFEGLATAVPSILRATFSDLASRVPATNIPSPEPSEQEPI